MPEPGAPPELTVRYTDRTGTRRRVVYEPSAAGGAWARREFARRDGDWRLVGSEPISRPAIDVGGGLAFAGP